MKFLNTAMSVFQIQLYNSWNDLKRFFLIIEYSSTIYSWEHFVLKIDSWGIESNENFKEL
jgi:hypothetical protein